MPCDLPNEPSMLALDPSRRDCARKAISSIKPGRLQKAYDGCSSSLQVVVRPDQENAASSGPVALLGELAPCNPRPGLGAATPPCGHVLSGRVFVSPPSQYTDMRRRGI